MTRLDNALCKLSDALKTVKASQRKSTPLSYIFPKHISVKVVKDVSSMNEEMKKAMKMAAECTEKEPCIIGVDTEWVAMENGVKKMHLLQLSVGNACILIRTEKVKQGGNDESATVVFSDAWTLFKMPNVWVVGHEIKKDLTNLFGDQLDMDSIRWLDIKDVARYMVWKDVFNECNETDLNSLTQKIFQVPLHKKRESIDWGKGTLEGPDKQYAACDVLVCRSILEQMFMKATLCNKTDLGIGEWIQEVKDYADTTHE